MLGNVSIFSIFLVDLLTIEAVVDKLKTQQQHSHNHQNERNVKQSGIATTVPNIISSTTFWCSDSIAASVVDVIDLVNSSWDTQTNDQDEDEIEEEVIFSLGSQAKLNNYPQAHQACESHVETTSGTIPRASDDSFDVGAGGDLSSRDCIESRRRKVWLRVKGDFLDSGSVGTLLSAVVIVVDFGKARDVVLIIASSLYSDTSKSEYGDSDRTC